MLDNKLKIGYFADGPWSHQAFELIIEDPSLDIQFIVPRTDTTDNSLKNYAKKHGIDYLFPVKINSVDFVAQAESYGCDLFVSMSFNQIFKPTITHVPRLGTINCHAGKLPFYRGRNILNWALINDEKDFGITVHYIDEGIDTGDIIMQRIFPITDDDTYSTLLQLAYKECAFILYDSIKKLQFDEVERIEQTSIHPIGFYCGKRGAGDEIINWNQGSRAIFNFIRALVSPGPIATTSCCGKKVTINQAKLVKGAPEYLNTPGQILKRTKDGYWVKTLDSFIEILQVESEVKLRIGDKLGQ